MIKKSAIKKLGIAPYDTAEYLKTEEDMAALLRQSRSNAGLGVIVKYRWK